MPDDVPPGRTRSQADGSGSDRPLKDRERQLALLRAVATVANETPSVEEALGRALAETCAYAGSPVGHAYLRDGDTLRSSGVWFLEDPDRFAVFRALTESADLPVGGGLPGRVAADAQPHEIVDLARDVRFRRDDAAAEAGLNSGFAFPLLAGSDVVGVLEFYDRKTGPVQADLLEVMAFVGTLLGQVVERARAEERLRFHALHDALTSLPNRSFFLELIKQAIGRARRHAAYRFAVLLIDVDGFRRLNDTLGHAVGDRLIVEIGERMKECLRSEDTIARPVEEGGAPSGPLAHLAGDEFLVMIENLHDASDAIRVARRIQDRLTRPFLMAGQPILVSASVGISLSSQDDEVPEEHLRAAHLALDRAKSQGKSGCAVFDLTMHERAVRRLQLEVDLRRAMEEREFRLHYQPIVSLPSGDIAGVEALIRWPRDGQLVMPGDFIPVAEETGLILPMGMWGLEEACRQLARWTSILPSERVMSMSVNFSPRQFAQPDFDDLVRRVLDETGLPPQLLRLEVTESAAMDDVRHTQVVLGRLKDAGVRISIDDFGTGFSSLAYLKRFPVDTLKIDRSFIAGVDHDTDSREIVRTIMGLARTLRMEVVAEGTENDAQVEFLQGIDCEYAQGYFFSRPIDPADLERALAHRSIVV
ncbi:MAG TPA: GGDEF domain-containing protein [Gemmatimonadota bacterium]|nr:GGDEF domain-containing protein [Gemmatimonadota bacterium]